MPVPVWVIILAVLAGLLLLAVLVFVMYRVSDGLWEGKGREQEERGRDRETREEKSKEKRSGHTETPPDEQGSFSGWETKQKWHLESQAANRNGQLYF